MKKIFLFIVILMLTSCELPDFSFNLVDKSFSEELIDNYLDKLNPDFVREVSLYSESHLLIMKTAIKGEISGNDLTESEDFNALFPYIIHGAMVTNAGFTFTQDEHIIACSQIVVAGIEICSDYEIVGDDKNIAYKHIAEKSIGAITDSGVESINIIGAVESIVNSLFSHGVNIDNKALLHTSLISLYENELEELDRIEIFNMVYKVYLIGSKALYSTPVEKYTAVKGIQQFVIESYPDLDGEDRILALDKITLTSSLINSSIIESENISELALSESAIEEELISGGVSLLRVYDNTLIADNIADSLVLESNIDMTRDDILLLIN